VIDALPHRYNSPDAIAVSASPPQMYYLAKWMLTHEAYL